MQAASASRYMFYVLPAMLGLYLLIRARKPASRATTALLTLFLLVCVAKETSFNRDEAALAYSTYKARWRDCYLSVHEIAACIPVT